MKCAHIRCKAIATHALQLLIPAKGHERREDNSVKALVGLKLCLAHASSARRSDVLADKVKEYVKVSLSAQGKAAPDFSRTKIEPIAFDDPIYVQWEASRATKQ